MPAENQFSLPLKDVVTLLVKDRDVHEGTWGLFVRFGIGAINLVNPATGLASPAAVVPIIELGIQKFNEPNSMTVDAAEVNPAPGGRKARGPRKPSKAR